MMKILHKNVELGDYNFGIAVDREIVADAFDKYPEVVRFMLKYTSAEEESDDFMLKALESHEFKEIFLLEENMEKVVKYAFPKMLKKADEKDGTDNAEHCEDLLEYIYDNDADEIFVEEMFKFLCLGFTADTTEKKPKITMTIK